MDFKTIKEDVVSEITEKKSRFIASVFKINSVEEAENIIKQIKKKYHDARHNCFAYSVVQDDGVYTKFSDDGEPSGTAGAPMLNVLTSNSISNVLVVVTRYFGGILLGTGGLVRAYTEATRNAITISGVIEQKSGKKVKIELSYSDYEKAKYYFEKHNIFTAKVEYVDNVIVFADMENKTYEELIKNLNKLNFTIIKYDKVCDTFI